MFKGFDKGISTPIAIAIVLLLAVSVGGITLWQYSEMETEKTKLLEVKISDKEEIEAFEKEILSVSSSLSKQDKEKMLRQMLKGNFSMKENEIISSSLRPGLSLSLEKIIENSFINAYANEYLFIVELSGFSSAGGFVHKFLGVFDESKNLVSLPINISEDTISENIFSVNSHFGGDFVDFGFYPCQGINYIFTTSGWCPNNMVCGNEESKLMQLLKGQFKTVQEFSYPRKETTREQNIYILVPEEKSIAVYKWGLGVGESYICLKPECIEYSSLDGGAALMFSQRIYFDSQVCRFKE